MPNKQPIKIFSQKFRSWYSGLPYDISVMAQKDFVQNFRQQGYINSTGGFVAWKQRKPIKGKKQKKDGILIQSGRLMRSLRPSPLIGTARVVTDVAYAQRHNEGFHGTEYVKPHKRVASSTRAVKYSSLKTKKTLSRKMKFEGKRHNVKGFARKANTPARPFMVTTPFLLAQIEKKVLNDLDKMFSESV